MNLHPSIKKAATDALLGNARVRTDAADELERMVRRDTKLLAALVMPHIGELCDRAVGVVISETRPPRETGELAPRGGPTERDSGAAIRALAAGNTAMLLATVLPSGVVLEKATRDEVTAAADIYEAKEKRAGRKSRWLRLVAQCVPGDKTVGRALTERRLQELREEADRG